LGGGKDRKGGQREGDRGRGTEGGGQREGDRGRGTEGGGQTGRGKGRETNREGGKIERGQREGRKGRKGGGRGDRQGEADRQWGLIRCSLVVGGRLCPWALAVCRHALGRSHRWGVVASVGARVRGWASRWESFSSAGGCCVRGRSRSWVGVVLVSGGLLRPWALAFEGGPRVGGRSCQWGVVASVGACVRGWASRSGSFSSVGCCYGGFRLRGGFSFSSGGCRPWAVVLCGWGTVVGCG
jgi:hypothetical protein